MLSSVRGFVIGNIWPWLKQYVWPAIHAKLISEIPLLVAWAAQKIKDIFSENSKERERDATEKAKEADLKAQESTDAIEIAELKKEAEIWRMVAQQYKEDLGAMKLKIDLIEQQTKAEIKEEINEVNPEVNLENGVLQLVMGGSKISIPGPDGADTVLRESSSPLSDAALKIKINNNLQLDSKPNNQSES